MAFLLHIVFITTQYLSLNLAYNLVFGKGKILHFGVGAQSLVATYTIWTLFARFDVPFLLALCIAIVATIAIALAMAVLSSRMEPDAFGVMSIALHLACFSVVLNWQSVTRGALGIPGIPRASFLQSNERFVAAAVVVTALWVLTLWLIDRSKIGRQLSALSEHEWHAESLGVNKLGIHCIAMVIIGLAALITNTFYPPYLYLLTPADYYFPTMIFFIMCVTAGGPGSLRGVTIATILIVFLREGLRFVDMPPDILGPVRLMLFGLILFLAVWWRRDSLFPQQRTI